MNTVQFLCSLYLICVVECGLLSTGLGKLKSVSIADCPVNGPKIETATKLINTDSRGTKALDATLILPYDFDASKHTFRLDISMCEGSTCRESVYSVGGNLCEYIQKYIPKLWSNLRNKLTPKVKEPCFLKQGTYELKSFEASTTDINIPSFLYGKLKLIFTVINEKNEEVLCKQYNVDSSI